MKFLTRPQIGRWVRKALRQAREVKIAVAYFHPDKQIREILLGVPKASVIVSEEFHINDPTILHALSRNPTVSIKFIPPGSPLGDCMRR